MENWNVITVECIKTFDPPVVRVTIEVLGQYYGIDINSQIYPELGAALGWPTNPCTEA